MATTARPKPAASSRSPGRVAKHKHLNHLPVFFLCQEKHRSWVTHSYLYGMPALQEAALSAMPPHQCASCMHLNDSITKKKDNKTAVALFPHLQCSLSSWEANSPQTQRVWAYIRFRLWEMHLQNKCPLPYLWHDIFSRFFFSDNLLCYQMMCDCINSWGNRIHMVLHIILFLTGNQNILENQKFSQ